METRPSANEKLIQRLDLQLQNLKIDIDQSAINIRLETQRRDMLREFAIRIETILDQYKSDTKSK